MFHHSYLSRCLAIEFFKTSATVFLKVTANISQVPAAFPVDLSIVRQLLNAVPSVKIFWALTFPESYGTYIIKSYEICHISIS